MKKLLVLLCALVLLALPCLARENLYVYDPEATLSEASFEMLTEQALEISEETGIDYLICITYEIGEQSMYDFATEYYNDSECGADALLMIFNEEKNTIGAYAFGNAADVFDDNTIDALEDEIVENSATMAYGELLSTYLNSAYNYAIAYTPDAPVMPDWYPEDVNTFRDFHAENPPHLIDNADLFTDEEEAEMLERILAIREEVGHDLVVYTDVTSYGLSRKIYAADFFQFNGYGFGDTYSGSVLFICMEPGNRGWWTAVHGDAMEILVFDELDQLDDKLYDKMSGGDYFDGVMEYLSGVETIYKTGHAPKDPPVLRALVCLAVGVIIALVVVGMMKESMNTVKKAAEANNYLVPGSFNLRKSYDIFLYRTVTRTKREKSSSSGGGGGSYSSSSGSSFSGSGRSF